LWWGGGPRRAGGAGGQDLLQYFLSFGAVGLIGIAALGVLNIIFGVVALQLGSYFRSGHHDEVFERITHPAVRRVIDVVLVFSGFAMGFVMLAGAGANLEQQFGLPAWAGSAVCAGLVILTAFLDFDRIMKVIGVFTPMIVIAIVILVIYSLVTPHPSVAELNATATKDTPAQRNRIRLRSLMIYLVGKPKGLNLSNHVHDAAVARLNDTDHALSELHALRFSGHRIGNVAELFDAL